MACLASDDVPNWTHYRDKRGKWRWNVSRWSGREKHFWGKWKYLEKHSRGEITQICGEKRRKHSIGRFQWLGTIGEGGERKWPLSEQFFREGFIPWLQALRLKNSFNATAWVLSRHFFMAAFSTDKNQSLKKRWVGKSKFWFNHFNPSQNKLWMFLLANEWIGWSCPFYTSKWPI